MKKLSFLKCLLGMMVLAPMGANAQVTVGAGTMPAATLDVVATAPDDATVPEGVMVPRLTKAQINAKQASYGVAQTDATVYVTDFSAPSVSGYSDRISCIGFAYWSGTQWMMNCDATTKTFVEAVTQPQPFTFYEQGTETPVALTFVVTGTSAITYEWRKIVGSNIHVRISEPCTAADGSGFDTASFTPASVIKGTTEDANNTGFYRYFCVATDQTGDEVTSNLAEVAVGCGAKDLNGEWLSFMCHNLGASANTMATQKASVISHPDYNSTGYFTHTAADRALYGDLYQWGRFADGHENRDAIQVGSDGGQVTDNSVAWNTSTPPTYETWTIPGTSPVAYGVWNQVARTGNGAAYFGKFIKVTGANNYSWFAVTGADVQTQDNADRLWHENASNYNDPCRKVKTDGTVPSGNVAEWYPPSSTSPQVSGTGWRLPNQGEWAMLYRGSSTGGSPANAMANTWVWWNQGNAAVTNGTKGFELRPDNVTTTLFLPASGTRRSTNALLSYAGNFGNYWSGSVSGGYAFLLTFTSASVTPAYPDGRGFGYALRCIKN